MPKFSFVLDVRDPPGKVIGAMIDFSDRRPAIWPNLSAKIYRAHSVGENTADVTEGTDVPGGAVWERVTYDWADTAVKSVITDSRLFQAGGRLSSGSSRMGPVVGSTSASIVRARGSWAGWSAR